MGVDTGEKVFCTVLLAPSGLAHGLAVRSTQHTRYPGALSRMEGGSSMHVGIAMFCTDYAMPPTALAVALEERGFESLWLPEHSHIP